MRQQGALEFLLSTPLSDREILRGQWQALRKRYLPVIILLLAVIWVPLLSFGHFLSTGDSPLLQGLMARLYVSLKAILVMLAAGWAGMFFGLNARRTQFAGLQAIVCAVFVPWIMGCLPEAFVSMIALVYFHSGVDGKVRRTIMEKIQAGQPI